MDNMPHLAEESEQLANRPTGHLGAVDDPIGQIPVRAPPAWVIPSITGAAPETHLPWRQVDELTPSPFRPSGPRAPALPRGPRGHRLGPLPGPPRPHRESLVFLAHCAINELDCSQPSTLFFFEGFSYEAQPSTANLAHVPYGQEQ